MTIWGLIQVVLDIFLFVGLFVCIVRSPRTSKDDPRLSRGLQLLQSKISVLEDLSDKTDVQFQKMMSVIEQKVSEVQQAVANAERQLQQLNDATTKGIETTRLVQTGLGAEQVIERHTNEIYARAAQLAFDGKSIDEICSMLELSRGEVELIVKFNRDSLRTVAAPTTAANPAPHKTQDLSHLFEVPQFDASSLNKIGDEFRRVTREVEQEQQIKQEGAQARFLGFAPQRQVQNVEFNEPPVLIPPSFEEEAPAPVAAAPTMAAAQAAPIQQAVSRQAPQPQVRVGAQSRELNSTPVVRKVIFPRIEK